jgi:glycosyltransferase involved in cell wall biosynthesis
MDLQEIDGSEKKADATCVLCFCHLRWDFVYQRPQHLMSRCQQNAKVFFFEEPLEVEHSEAALRLQVRDDGATILTPMLPKSLDSKGRIDVQRELLDGFIEAYDVHDFIAWYYTPMALRFSDHLDPAVVVYDCMDELSAFDGAPTELPTYERMLFDYADVVFVGGRTLYNAKLHQHGNIHLFPSSVDRDHFAVARRRQSDPSDQHAIPHPRIGFFGVLDERLDRELLREAAELRPDWHFVLLGPVVKIREEDLPRAQNIHYLGQKRYEELPIYLANWDVAMLPFAINSSTQFISPTKTLEYLAAGKPVVSTPIRDVVEPYGNLGLVSIATNAQEFCEAIESLLKRPSAKWLEEVDDFLRKGSWDRTFSRMWQEINRVGAQGADAAAHAVNSQQEAANV